MARSGRTALLALLLLLPVPSLAVLAGMVWFPNSALGRGLFVFGKLWILILPLLWLWCVDRRPVGITLPSSAGMALGAASGLVIGAIIGLSYWLIGRHVIDATALRNVAAQVGLTSASAYLWLALYWVLVNSLLEEYIWRWFAIQQARRLMPSGLAISVAAAGFTLHHFVVMRIYFPDWLAMLAASGVFCGGLIWSWMYLRYQTIWPGYLSHIIVDIAIFAIGFQILFSV